MRILLACESSGRVRDAFLKRGHDAWSCDILPSETPGPHRQCDVLGILDEGWDMTIAFPPCTHLASSGARWFKEKRADGRQQQGVDFFMAMVNAPIERIAIENPVGIMSTAYRKPDQIIQPWWFGHGETKATCLWLKNLPPLVPTTPVTERKQKIHKLSALNGLGSSRTRQVDRSRTYLGIADAMAEQWGGTASGGTEELRP